MKIVSGHQPVYLPWLGLIHKAYLADVFIFMDDVQYLTKDWNNRNKIKTAQGQSTWLTVPVDLKSSESKLLKDIVISCEDHLTEKKKWQYKHWTSLKMSYSKAPFFKKYAEFFEWLYLENNWGRLSLLNLEVLKQIFKWFDIKAQLIIASEQNFTGVKSDLVLEHGLVYGADILLTGVMGKDYIEVDKFNENGMDVVFQEYMHPVYSQRFNGFVSHLSFVDLLFNCGPNSLDVILKENMTRENIKDCVCSL